MRRTDQEISSISASVAASVLTSRYFAYDFGACTENTRVCLSQAKVWPDLLSMSFQDVPSADPWSTQPVGAFAAVAEVSVYWTAFVPAAA